MIMLKSYVFDLDQNILYTKTPIYLLIKQPGGSRQEEPIPNAEYEKRLQDKENAKFHEDIEYSCREFRWYGKLIRDVFEVIDNGGPSWNKFKTATIECSPTDIVSDRGNALKEFREIHKKIIYEVLNAGEREEMIYNMRNHLSDRMSNPDTLIDIYLNNNLYIPCNNPEFVKIQGWWNKTSAEKKALAFEKCITKTIDTYTSYYGEQFMKNRHISIWFSDDNKKYTDSMQTYITSELIKKFPEIKFALYDTSDPKNIRKQIFGNSKYWL